MGRLRTSVVLTAAGLALAAAAASAQPIAPVARLPIAVLDVTPPAERVTGAPGTMRIRSSDGCRNLPLADVRARLVALAVQEWGFFGFPIVEYDAEEDDAPPARGRGDGRGRGASRIGTPEAARTAATIAGYWAVAPGGAWILESQNEHWRAAISGVTRWRFPWSAAFLSWLMCEGGLGGNDRFQRGIAHHTYIDQAIRARATSSPRAAYVAHDPGDVAIAPGDLLCTSRRPVYRTIDERRRQMGQGARTHCDLVVKVDEPGGRILAIGGNVRGVVGLKVFPAGRNGGQFRPLLPPRAAAERPMFAHLKLRGPASTVDLFEASPTMRVAGCALPTTTSAALRTLLPRSTRC